MIYDMTYILKKRAIYLFIPLLILVSACEKKENDQSWDYQQVRTSFQQPVNGKKVDLHLLENKNGIKVTITNYGGRIVHLFVPDNKGQLTDVVLGYNSLDGFLNSNEAYFGALIGRYGNRIAKAQFMLNDTTYQLTANNGPNSLHGGPGGYHNVVWEIKETRENAITLSYLSPDGEEGFPGNLQVEMTYTLTDQNELVMDYKATTDRATPINLTNHAFFNLNGDGSGNINEHTLQVEATHYIPVDEDLIPTGEIAPVTGTPFDFTTSTVIGARINDAHQQLKLGKGYDHTFVLDKGITKTPERVASAKSPLSGIELQVLTTEPGLQLYGGNFLNGSDTGKNGTYEFRGAFCLETQHFPDSPNQPNFPTVILEPGETYSSQSIYKFILPGGNG